LAFAAAQGPIPANLRGKFTGTLSFGNQVFAGFDNTTGTPNMGITIFSGCCPEIYTEPATLTVTDTVANFTSPGASGVCGPSTPGYILFTGVQRVGTSGNSYTGSLNLNGQLQGVPAKFMFFDDFTVKLDIFAAITDFSNSGRPGPPPTLNNLPYAWSGAATTTGLPCSTAPGPYPVAGPGGPYAATILTAQALSGKFSLVGSAFSATPSFTVALLVALYTLKQLF
jgi:hypothetical protein